MIKLIKELPAYHEDINDLEKIEKAISDLLKKEFYEPLMEIFEQEELLEEKVSNSIEGLKAAIKSGQIFFYRGTFKGKFNASLTRELKTLGAKWDRKHGSFRIPLSELPTDVKDVIQASEYMFIKMSERLDKKLSSLYPEQIASKLSIDKLFDSAIYKVDKSVEKNLKNIGVDVQFSAKDRKKIVDEYVRNTEKDIKNFLKDETKKLREISLERARTGQRAEGLINEVLRSHDVGMNKAKFIARQETKLAVSKTKEARYIDAGCPWYIWRCSAGSLDHPVRHDHKILEGKKFRWDSPPITDKKSGRRNNPQEDFNCRCTAVPIVIF